MEPLRAEDPRQVGRYRLAARLGSGGMGRVYLGFSPAGRAVAVKVIRPELARDQGFVGRFRREVAAARLVNGLYTATVVDASDGAEAPWLATAFVPGPALADVVEAQGPLAEDPVWRLAGGLVEALAVVHACGLVHRDLKPANVLLAVDGPRVIDFGISLALEGTALTGTGLTVGTPGFMSPEQADGERAGPASDVFSLGSVLAYAATGTGPFGGGPAAAVIYRVVHGEPDLAGVPSGLRDLAARCLVKDPAQRPGLAELMDRAARQVPADSAVSFWPPSLTQFIAAYQADLAIPPPSPAPTPPAEATQASGTSAASYQPSQETATQHPRQARQPTAAAGHPTRPPAPEPGDVTPPADGPPAPVRVHAHPARRRARRRAALAIGIVSVVAVTAPVLVTELPHRAVSSHGRTVPSGHPSQASSAAITATLVRTLTDPGSLGVTPATHVSAVAFSPDGKLLATGYASADYTYLWRTRTGHRTAALRYLLSGGVTALAFSPDGKLLATGDYYSYTFLWDTATHRRSGTLTAPDPGIVTALAFSPDGRTLATGEDNGGVYLWHVAARRLTVTLTAPGSPPTAAVAFSPDGRTLATGDDTGHIYLRNAATGHQTAGITGPGSQGVTAVAFSPDGKLLAAGDTNGHTYLWDTATWRLAGTVTAPGSPPVTAVAFSPDGKLLAAGGGNGHTCLWDTATWRLAGTVTAPGSPPVTAVAFSPDGKLLAAGGGNLSTYLWSVGG